MPVFFANPRDQAPVGRVIGCQDEHTAGTLHFVSSDPGIGFQQHKSIITRMTVSQQGNFQFLHTIGNDVYIYVFGDRMGSVTLSGLSFTYDCNSPGDSDHGFEKIYDWYRDSRVAKRRTPVRVHLGQRTTFEGFVVGVTGDVVDPSTRIMQYGIQMVTIPERD